MRALIVFLLVGCPSEKAAPDTSPGETGAPPVDADGDGYVAADDCDDEVAGVHPGAEEICDGVDQDCDGEVDEGTLYVDADADGYGDPAGGTGLCDAPPGSVVNADDCNDTDASIHPDAEEVCDGIDQDCDGTIDDHPADDDRWYTDADGDGYGDPDSSTRACDQPAGTVSNRKDCDDGDASVNPEATESWYDGVDQDCDEASDYDVDGDGYESETYGGLDCEDEDSSLGGPEVDSAEIGAAPLCGTMEVDGKLYGEAAGSQVGASYCGQGDVDGDGEDDVVARATTVDADGKDTSAAYVMLGPVTGERSLSAAVGKVLGAGAVVGLGSMDSDLYSDFVSLIEDAEGASTLSVFQGPVIGDLTADDADCVWYDEDQIAFTLQLAGDTDGDGLDDVLTGYNDGTDRGTYLLTTLSTGTHDLSEVSASFSRSGENCSEGSDSAGDTDADGLDDIILTCVGGDLSGGYLFFGSVSGTHDPEDADAEILYFFAESANGAGDTNGDGYDDLLMGWMDSREAYLGYVLLIEGPFAGAVDASATAVATWTGSDENEFARVGASGSDLDGDGLADFTLWTHASAWGTSNAAVSFVLNPTVGAHTVDDAIWTLDDGGRDDTYGYVEQVGDMNSDGLPDIGIGETRASTATEESGVIWLVSGGDY